MESAIEPVYFECTFCPKTFKYRRALNDHIQKFHPSTSRVAISKDAEFKLQECPECCKRFIHEIALNDHMRKMHPNLCVSAENKENIKKLKDNILMCNLCSRTYSSKQTLKEHIQNKHNSCDESKQNCEWKCAICERTHCTRAELVEHVAEDHCLKFPSFYDFTDGFKCGHCEKIFQQPTSLNKHTRQMHPQIWTPLKTKGTNFICNACGNSFWYRKTLIRHIQDKHPEEMCAEIRSQAHKCPVCRKKFEYFLNLKQHLRENHPGEDNSLRKNINRHFNCDICKMSFQRRYSLTRHKLIKHPSGLEKRLASKKMFLCDYCPKGFYYKFNMLQHSRRKHSEKWNLPPPEPKNKIMCNLCCKKYSRRISLIFHIRQKHPHTIMPACKGEKNTFSNEPLETFKRIPAARLCPLCSEAYIRKSDICKHFRESHGKMIRTHALDLADENAFDEWKRRFELETRSKFVKYNCYRSKKQIVRIFICHRSGCFQSRSRGLRQLRLAGSEKINGYCPAELKFTCCLATNKCTVHYVDEHVGHGQELQFLKLEEPLQNQKADDELDLSAVVEQNLYRDAALSTSAKETNLDDKQLFDAIVLSSWIADNVDSVLYFKGPEETDPDFPELESGIDGDFIFIIMNDFQSDMFVEYGSDIVAVSRMEGPEDYDLEIFVVMVIDNYRQGIPCCLMLSNRNDQYAYEILFKKMSERAGKPIQPNVFMSEMCDAYVNAWRAVMPPPERHLLCSWYVLRCWEKNLSLIGCPKRRKQMRQFLHDMRMELSPFRFHERLQQILNVDDDDLNRFVDYFRQHFVKIESSWAYCYRKYAGINTNYVCDRFFRSFRRRYLRNQTVFTFEDVLDALTLLLKKLPHEKLVREVKGKLVAKIKLLRVRHAVVEKYTDDQLNTINRISSTKWYVPSFDDESLDDIYHVERVLERCDCKLLCRGCRSCLHMYRCSCLDNCIQYNMCTHIHAVCMLMNQSRVHNDDDLVEELEVNEVDPSVKSVDLNF